MLAKKILLNLLLLTLSLGVYPAIAQQTDNSSSSVPTVVNQLINPVQQLDNLTRVTAQDFGNIKTGWFSNLWRDIRIIFTFDPVKKADLELEKATAVLLRARQEVLEKGNQTDPSQIRAKMEKAVQRYERAMEKASLRLEKYKQKHPDDQRVDKFLDKFSDFSLKHQMVFESLEKQTPSQVRAMLEQQKKKNLKRFIQTMEKVDNSSALKSRLKKMLLSNQIKFEQRVMRAHFLDELETLDLDDQTKQKITELKQEVKPLWEELHQTYQQAVTKRQQTIEALKKEAKAKKDELINDPQARHEFIKKVNQTMQELRQENRKLYQEKREKVKQFIEEHQDELMEIKDKVRPLIKHQSQQRAEERMENKNEIKKNTINKATIKQIQPRTQVKEQAKVRFHQIDKTDE